MSHTVIAAMVFARCEFAQADIILDSELEMQSDGVCRATHKAMICLATNFVHRRYLLLLQPGVIIPLVRLHWGLQGPGVSICHEPNR